jgi:proline iminopeptidase
MDTTPMRRLDDHLYPITNPINEGHLPVGGPHQVFWQEAGNPDGVPVVLVHGGPGGSNSPAYRSMVNPTRWRIIQFDQRGCGQSKPTGELEDNTTQALVADMEELREHLGIGKWVVAGGSWGTTLSLVYAETHPDRCLGLMLLCLWLARKEDYDWWMTGVRTVFPEVWDEYASYIPEDEHEDLMGAYFKRILDPNPEVSRPAAIRQYYFEQAYMHLEPPMLTSTPEETALNYSRIYAHYLSNRCFIEENQILKNAYRLKGMPVVIVTGRYDMCTPPKNAYDLAQVLINAELNIVNIAGHMPTERSMSIASVRAGERLWELLHT